MLSDLLQDRAALYVSGGMTETERQSFEVLLEFDPELRRHVDALRETVATALAVRTRAEDEPPAGLRERILAAAEKTAQEREPDALLVTDAAGRVIWMNAAFERLCGRPLADMAGRKPGQVLQGPQTDPATVERIRHDLAAERATDAWARKQAGAARRREREQAEYVEDFHAAVLAFLAFDARHAALGGRLARAVTDHATPVGSGTVARTQRIPIERRAEAAVIAWMRHQTTGYDAMKIARVKGQRREVRRMLAQRSKELLAAYRRGEPASPACPLARALASPQSRSA